MYVHRRIQACIGSQEESSDSREIAEGDWGKSGFDKRIGWLFISFSNEGMGAIGGKSKQATDGTARKQGIRAIIAFWSVASRVGSVGQSVSARLSARLCRAQESSDCGRSMQSFGD